MVTLEVICFLFFFASFFVYIVNSNNLNWSACILFFSYLEENAPKFFFVSAYQVKFIWGDYFIL